MRVMWRSYWEKELRNKLFLINTSILGDNLRQRTVSNRMLGKIWTATVRSSVMHTVNRTDVQVAGTTGRIWHNV